MKRGQKILALQSAQRAADRETSQPSRLLTLPAELRTEIFALALEDTDYINITEQLKPPGLLSACRQVREETWPIWISQNRFFLHLHGFDHRLFSKWYKLVGGVDPAGITVGMIFDNVYDWENLLRWCRAEHADQSVNVPATEDGDVVDGSLTSYAVAYGALAIAHGMSGTPWPTCEFVLRKFRFALSCAGVEWE